jgi:hypothetical protein
MRQFYEVWRDVSEELVTLLRKLLWSSHVDLLGRCKTTEVRSTSAWLSMKKFRSANFAELSTPPATGKLGAHDSWHRLGIW